MTKYSFPLIGLAILFFSVSVGAADGVLPAVTVKTAADGSTEYSVTMQILLLMTSLSFLPAMVIMLTSFTRIIVVLSILRQAIGLQQTPSNQVLIGMSLFMTFLLWRPCLTKFMIKVLNPISMNN